METFSTGLDFAPLLPWPYWATLAGLAVLMVLAGIAISARGIWWRAGALGVVMLVLANPGIVHEKSEALSDVALVVLDESPSQGLEDRRETAEAALKNLEARLGALEDLEVRVRRVGGRGDSETRLFSAIENALIDVPADRVAGVVAITDGQVHDVPAITEGAAALAYPVHVLLTGRLDAGDRRLVIQSVPRYGIVGRTLELTVRIEDPAGGQARPARLMLSVNGEAALERQVMTGKDETLSFTLDRPGESLVEIEVAAGPTELTLQNNRAALLVNGVRDRLRVLLVSGEPHVGERVWRNTLKADPSVDLIHFTILRPPEKQDGTPVAELALIPFPIRELFQERLSEFDLIIFDRYRQRGLLPRLYIHNIVDFVEQGGALLVAAGPSFAGGLSLARTPIGRILPAQPTGQVIEQSFRPKLTETGKRHPVTAKLSANEGRDWGNWSRQIAAEVTGGQVLLAGVEGRPLLVLDRRGAGRVAQVMSDHVWLWAKGFDGGGPHGEFLKRVAHWLMKEPELEENALRARAEGTGGNTELRIERHTLAPADTPVTVTSPSGETTAVPLGQRESGAETARLKVTEAGLYRLTDGERSAIAGVGTLNAREFSEVSTTRRHLDPVAAATGGGIYAVGQDAPPPSVRRVSAGRDLSGSDWIGLRDNRGQRILGVTRVPLLPVFLVLAFVLAGLAGAWWRESR